MSMTTESRQQRLHDVHEHLRYASTSDSPEVIRERMRQAELMLQHAEAEAPKSEQDNEFWNR